MTTKTDLWTRLRAPRRRGSPLDEENTRLLLPVQALHSGGEALFALSLVGSLFFNVSVDAARPRILLYLALTMAPFAVLAPLAGPLIDRLRSGARWVLLASLVARSAMAMVLAENLQTLLLYPEAFVIVAAAKIYVVSRNALVPSIIHDRNHLVIVNSLIARTGAVAGVVAALLGVGILQLGGAPWVLRAGAVFYGAAAVAALRMPRHDAPVSRSPSEVAEMHGPGIRNATVAMIGLRTATGFVFFHVGFSLKTSGQPAWVIGLVAVSAAVGGFAGTYVAPWLRNHLDGQLVLVGSLLGLSAMAAVATIRFHSVTAVLLAIVLGLAGSIGRRAFDGVVQTEAPHARRGRAYAGLETRLEIGWVVGALAAVAARLPDWMGMAFLTAGLVVLGIDRALAWRRVHAPELASPAAIPFRLLETAEALAAQGDSAQSAIVALAAVEAAIRAEPERVEVAADLEGHRRRLSVAPDAATSYHLLEWARSTVTDVVIHACTPRDDRNSTEHDSTEINGTGSVERGSGG